MEVNVKYFGSMAEATGKSEEKIFLEYDDRQTGQIRSYCFAKYGLMEDPAIRLAVNQVMQDDGIIRDGDEIAFLPPYAGG